MSMVKLLFAIACICVMASVALAAKPEGLTAEWNFDEGKGDVANDSSGNGHDAKLYGATWVKQGDGFALRLNGRGDYVDCGRSADIGIGGPVTVEAWVKPMARGPGGGVLMGTSREGYLLTYRNRVRNRGFCRWHIGSARNEVGGSLELGEWNHVAATFDGKRRSLWINGRLAASLESLEPPRKGGNFTICSAKPPHFKGMLDRVRVYNRAVSAAEAVAHFKAEAGNYGFDSTWFQRVKVTPFYYLDRGRVVVEMDYKGLQPLEGKGRIEVTLSNQSDEATSIGSRVIEPLPDAGIVEAELPCKKLTAGTYVIRVTLRDDKGARPMERITFDYPPKPLIPSPAEKVVGSLPPSPAPVPFELEVGKGGGFRLLIKGTSYPFESRISWPNGDFNRLSASDEPARQGEKSWKVEVRPIGTNRYTVEAGGTFYTIHRQIEVFPTHVYIKDAFTNTTDEDLGLLIYNETAFKDGQITGCWLAGYEGRRRIIEMPGYGSPSVFVTDRNVGIGMVPLDDVYVIQSVLYAEDGAAGMGTQKFALAPKGSYTLEWAIYPTGSGDYYDFTNTFRKVEGRISTVDGAPGFISYGPKNRRQVPSKDFIEKRGLKIGIIHCLSAAADDPGISIEGIEFMDFPKEMELLKKQIAAIKKKHPGFKVVFHVIHTLYATNNPDKFADSKLIRANGTHPASGGAGAYFSKERADEGWRWYYYYPTPGNSFHDAMMKSVDVMMDEIGADGAFMDGFFYAYPGRWGRWTYDGRWDGHSAEIDPETKTIKRKLASVLLLSQPSMIQFARKIRDKGGIVIGNAAVMTRSIANEKYILFDAEHLSGPEWHLAPSSMALSNPKISFNSEKEIYLDVLDKLSWGVLYMHYNDRIPLTYPSLAARQFPMTFEEIRSGLVRGKERIVTMNSGVYGWPGDRRLHAVYKFDARGAPAPHDFMTTVDEADVRTELEFGKNESAVIEPISMTLEASTPVNVRVLQYEDAAFKILLNGQGEATLDVFVGTSYPDWRDGVFPQGGVNPADVGVGAAYRVTAGGASTTIAEIDGTLSVPLTLDGQVEVVIERADGGE